MLVNLVSIIRIEYRRLASLGFAAVAIACLPAVSGAQWQVTPSIGIGLQYDDNASLITSSDQETSVNGYLAEAEVSFSHESQLTRFELSPGALVRKYDQNSDLDSDDFFVDLQYDYSGERSRFRTRASYSDESARTAERAGVDFDIIDPDEIPEDDSGLVLGTESRKRTQIAPLWSYQAGQKSTISIGGNYIDVSYDDEPGLLNSDFREMTGNLGYEHKLSERSGFAFDGYYRKNEFESLDTDLSGYGATVGFNRLLTENTLFTVKAGMDSTEDLAGDNQSNPVGEISLARSLQRSKVLASYRRVVSGSGAGEISLRDSLSLNLTRDLSRRVSAGAGIRAYRTKSIDKDIENFDERDYFQLRASITWHLTAVFAVELDYSYTELDREGLPSDASSNLINLWIRYQALR